MPTQSTIKSAGNWAGLGACGRHFLAGASAFVGLGGGVLCGSDFSTSRDPVGGPGG